MKNYVINIFSVVILIAIFTLILPNGKMQKHVKSIFAVIISFVIISPILTLGKEDFNSIITSTEFTFDFDKNYLNYVWEIKNNENKDKIIKILNGFGINEPKVEIQYIVTSDGNYEVLNTSVDLISANYDEEDFSTKKIEIVEQISSILNVKKDKVIFYE